MLHQYSLALYNTKQCLSVNIYSVIIPGMWIRNYNNQRWELRTSSCREEVPSSQIPWNC